MDETEKALDECLQRMANGATIDACIAEHPEQAAALRPALTAAEKLARGASVIPRASYRQRARTSVMAYAQTHPHTRRDWLRPAWRMVAAAAVLMVVMMLSTTAFAQAALPGQSLYGLKLASEQAWRALAPDRVGVDLHLADRRADELARTAENPAMQAEAQAGYHAALEQLQQDDSPGNGPRIEQALQAHENKFRAAGIRDQKLDELLHGKKP